MKILFFDLETTGLNPEKHGIHQISGQIVIDGELKESFNFHVQPHPEAEINPEALKIGNVTEDKIMDYPPMKSVYKEFIKILSTYVNKFDKRDKFFLAGYNNAHFDNQFLRSWFLHNGDKYFSSWFWANSIDVYILATPVMAIIRPLMRDFKQSTVAATLGIKVDESALHDAMYDIQLCREIFDKISPNYIKIYTYKI